MVILKKKNLLARRASRKSIVVARPPKKCVRASGHIANVKPCNQFNVKLSTQVYLVLSSFHRPYTYVCRDNLTVGADTRYRCHREFGDRRESVVAARTYLM